MTPIEITCTPPGAIVDLSPDTTGALDLLALTIPGNDWTLELHIGETTLTARPAPELDQPEDAA